MDAQKKTFIALAYRLVLSDLTIARGEELFFDYLKRELGLTETTRAGAMLEEPDVSCFEEPRHIRAMLLELLSLAHSDRNFSDDQIKILYGVAEELNVSSEDMDWMAEWANKRLSLVQEAIDFMER